MRYAPLAAATSTAGRWSVIALGLSIPVSVALDNILMGLIAMCWLLGGDWSGKARMLRTNPVVIAALLLFGLLAIGTVYPDSEARTLPKYIDLLLIPAFVTFFREDGTRLWALRMFFMAAIASIIVSYLVHFGLLADISWFRRDPAIPTGFKYTITHSIIVSYAAYLFALLALREKIRARRIGYALLALFAIHNVVFMVYSRTGYCVIAALFLYFFVVNYGRRGLLLVAAAMALTFAAAYATSDIFHQRIDAAVGESIAWRPGEPSQNSVGLRLEWYSTTLKIIHERPLLGSGTGSFPELYARAVAGSEQVATTNPHNEYLLLMVQIGVLGLLSLLYLYWQQWRFAARIPDPLYRHLARGVVLTFALGCLFNSLLIDHTEGLLFAWLTGLVFAAAVPATVSAETSS
ncbi:MAG: O-antigen ligase family protein [Betaproteobacteria bacterium]|nr:O-antigen ligase family protein [Betaproteobacteria bacterium]